MKQVAVTFVGIAAMLFTVPAWSNGDEERNTVAIDIVHPWNGALSVIDDLKDELSGIDVTQTIKSDDELRESIDSNPHVFWDFDVFGFPPSWGEPLMTSKLLANICDCIASKNIDVKRLHGIVKIPNSHWMLPIPVVDYYQLYFNKDLFKDAGLDDPPTSHQEFLRYAEALTDNNMSVHGLVLPFPSGVATGIYPLIWSSGETLMVSRKPNLEIESVINVLRLVKTLYSKSSMPNPTMTEKEAERYFVEGSAAMMIGPSEYGHRWRHMYPELNFGVALVPAYQNVPRPIPRVRVGALGVLKNSERQQEACSLIAHIASKDTPFDTGDPELPVELNLLFAQHVNHMLDGQMTEKETAAAIQQAWVSELAIYP